MLHCSRGEADSIPSQDPGEPLPGPVRQAGGKEGIEQGAMPHVCPNVPPPSPVRRRRLTDCRTTAVPPSIAAAAAVAIKDGRGRKAATESLNSVCSAGMAQGDRGGRLG